MNEIVAYKILWVRAKRDLLSAMEEKMQKALADGWQSYGELHTGNFTWGGLTQVVVTYKTHKAASAATA